MPEDTVHVAFVVGGEAFERGEAVGCQRHEDGATVGVGGRAAHQPVVLEAVHHGGGIAVRDEQHPAKAPSW